MPIVMSKEAWARIVKWTDSDKEDPEAARRREYVRSLDMASAKMTKTWPNSLENVNKRNEEMRRARIEAAEDANTKFYRRYVKRQRENQQRLMHSARDIIFKNKDAPKLLLSAVIETAIQKERQEQLKFIAERRREEVEQKNKDDEDIIKKAKEWHELMANRNKKRFEINKQHQKEILDQAHEVSERKRMEYETELNLQKIDNIKAEEQMDAIREFEEKFKAEEKLRIFRDMEQAKKETEARKKEQAARDEMDDRLIDVLNKSRARVENTRKQTEKQLRNEKLRVLEAISQKLESGDAARDAKEQAILDKAINEKDAINEARYQGQLRKEAQFKQDRIDARHQFLKDEERRLHELDTMKQWEIMNRFKNCELYEDYKEKKRQKQECKTNEYRNELIRLWKEREDREAHERAETRYFYGELAERKLRDADNKLLTHAGALVQEARRLARPRGPLQRAVDRYCKLYRLYPTPELPRSMQEHFGRYAPRDVSRPEPGYRDPPPPPEDRGPDAPDTPDTPPADHRDGLRTAHDTTGTSTSVEAKKEENVDDYKRVGRANGLQRKGAQTEMKLPPIQVTPGQTQECPCHVNKK